MRIGLAAFVKGSLHLRSPAQSLWFTFDSSPLPTGQLRMPLLRSLTVSAQAAAHIRSELERGRWSQVIPGVYQLAAELGVNRKTIESALQQLEHEGLLRGQGQGRKRRIVESYVKSARSMRVALLLYESTDLHLDYIVELQHALVEAGHTLSIASKSLTELKMDVSRVSRLVAQTSADAWILLAGSREVVAWFCQQPMPAFALFGRQEGLPIAAAGPNKIPAFAAAARHLVELGHSRIVLVTRRERRLPELGRSERAFINELMDHGIQVGNFNLPEWEETREGIHALLNSLFRLTPPTALMIEEAPIYAAVQQFLSNAGIRVPQQVSLICTDYDPTFAWCLPAISHVRWAAAPLVRRIVRWAENVSQGKSDIRQTGAPAEFVIGGTTGPVMVSATSVT
jgi:DNA-binding LacI/PurR family transcriptional regulator